MEKAKLLELIRRQGIQNGVGSADDIGRVTLRQVEMATSQVYADAIMMLVKDSQSLDFFTKTYNDLDIEYDRTENVYYTTLPKKIIQLSGGRGIKLVKAVGTGRKFYPSSHENVDIFTDTDIATHYDRTLYMSDGAGRILYRNFDYASHNVRKVSVKLVIAFEEYEWDEDIHIPSGKSTEFTDIIAKKIFQSNKFLDTSSDGQST